MPVFVSFLPLSVRIESQLCLICQSQNYNPKRPSKHCSYFLSFLFFLSLHFIVLFALLVLSLFLLPLLPSFSFLTFRNHVYSL